MQLRIFNRRREEIRKQAGQIPPGQLTANNSIILGMAAKYVRYFLAASAAAVVIIWYLIGQVEPGGKAHETLNSSATIVGFGVVALAVIFALFKGAEWCEGRALALDDRDDATDPDYPPRPPVRRYMERAIFMIQLGYRLVVFAGICIVVGVVYIFKGLYAM
ncbi:MAG: hypothetical protein VX430_10565 [Pseudomonadota bacterium]|nr:hypothetical protein [Pseudomonadota bacterium]